MDIFVHSLSTGDRIGWFYFYFLCLPLNAYVLNGIPSTIQDAALQFQLVAQLRKILCWRPYLTSEVKSEAFLLRREIHSQLSRHRIVISWRTKKQSDPSVLCAFIPCLFSASPPATNLLLQVSQKGLCILLLLLSLYELSSMCKYLLFLKDTTVE